MSKYKKISTILFCIYIGLALWITIFSREPDYSFIYIRPLWKSYSYHWLFYGDIGILRNIILNIIFFIPFGFLLSASVNRKNISTLLVVLLCTILFSSSIEFTQYYYRLGVFEIDDIFNNTIGSLVGFILYMSLKNIYIMRNKQ